MMIMTPKLLGKLLSRHWKEERVNCSESWPRTGSISLHQTFLFIKIKMQSPHSLAVWVQIRQVMKACVDIFSAG